MPASCYLCNSKNPEFTLHSFPKNNELRNLWKESCGLRLDDDVSRCYVCSKHFTAKDYVEPNAKQLGGRLFLKPNRVPTVKVPNRMVLAVPPKSEPEMIVPDLINVESSISPELAVSLMPTEMLFEIPIEVEAPTSTGVLEMVNDPIAVPNPMIVAESSASPEPAVSTMPTDTIMCTPKKRKFAEPRYAGEITSSDFATPKMARRTWNLAKEHINKQRKRNSMLEQRNRRLTRKVAKLEALLKRLRAETLMCRKCGCRA